VGLAPITGVKFHAEDVPPMPTVTGRVRCAGPIMAEDFRFWSVATAAPKRRSRRRPCCTSAGASAISASTIRTRRVLGRRRGRVPRGDRAYAAAGTICARRRELPTSAIPSCATACAPAATTRRLPRTYAVALNQAPGARPGGMTVTMHTCRGNFRSTWLASGGYEDAVVEAMFSTDVDAYFMEWDSERAGGFEPLRLLPRGKTVVLGLVTTKSGALEPKDTLARRMDEAARHVPLDRLCLSPQCGFASTHHGNPSARTSSGESSSAWSRSRARSGAHSPPNTRAGPLHRLLGLVATRYRLEGGCGAQGFRRPPGWAPMVFNGGIGASEKSAGAAGGSRQQRTCTGGRSVDPSSNVTTGSRRAISS
jgi:hypothetical protein